MKRDTLPFLRVPPATAWATQPVASPHTNEGRLTTHCLFNRQQCDSSLGGQDGTDLLPAFDSMSLPP